MYIGANIFQLCHVPLFLLFSLFFLLSLSLFSSFLSFLFFLAFCEQDTELMVCRCISISSVLVLSAIDYSLEKYKSSWWRRGRGGGGGRERKREGEGEGKYLQPKHTRLTLC